MMVYTIEGANTWPRRNQARFLFIEMCALEYQFEVCSNADRVFIGFYKGDYSISVNGETVLFANDGGSISYLENEHNASDTRDPKEEFVLALLLDKATNEKEFEKGFGRKSIGAALWEYIGYRIPGLASRENFTFTVHLPGRNGYAYRDGVVCDRKDW